MSKYYVTEISFWKTRNKFYFQIKNKLDKLDIVRVSEKKVEDLVKKKTEIENEIKLGLYGQEKITLKNVFDRFMESLQKRKNPPRSSLRDYPYCAKQLWTITVKNKLIQNMDVKDFTTEHCNLINVYMNENFTVRYNKECFGLLNRLFKYAVGHGLIAYNPNTDVDRSDFATIKSNYNNNKQDPVLVQGGFEKSLTKINGLLEKLKEWNFQHFVMVRLMCELGGRMGEVLPLLIQDYNIGTNTIDINKTVNTATNVLHHRTKTKTGKRTVALSDEMGNLLKKLINIHLGSSSFKDLSIREKSKGLLFPSERNTILQGNNVANRIINKFNDELGIVGRINPHSFRVFVITLREYLEHKKKHMMQDAGHANKQISDLYVRGGWINVDRKRKDANEIAGFLG